MRRVECERPHGMHRSCYNPTLVKKREYSDKTYLEDKCTYPKIGKNVIPHDKTNWEKYIYSKVWHRQQKKHIEKMKYFTS